MIFLSPEIQILPSELEFSFARSSGPGGQNVNKVNSKAILRWNFLASVGISLAVRERFLERFGSKLTKLGEIVISSDRYRDQTQNQADCIEKLRLMLTAVAVAPKPRKKTRPTFSSKTKRKESKRQRGQIKKNRRPPSWEDG